MQFDLSFFCMRRGGLINFLVISFGSANYNFPLVLGVIFWVMNFLLAAYYNYMYIEGFGAVFSFNCCSYNHFGYIINNQVLSLEWLHYFELKPKCVSRYRKVLKWDSDLVKSRLWRVQEIFFSLQIFVLYLTSVQLIFATFLNIRWVHVVRAEHSSSFSSKLICLHAGALCFDVHFADKTGVA